MTYFTLKFGKKKKKNYIVSCNVMRIIIYRAKSKPGKACCQGLYQAKMAAGKFINEVPSN
jgi:hypothetical protein